MQHFDIVFEQLPNTIMNTQNMREKQNLFFFPSPFIRASHGLPPVKTSTPELWFYFQVY